MTTKNQSKVTIDVPLAATWKDGELILLDQTRLPNEVVEEKQETVEQVWDSIKKLKVRGAPAIGIAGAYGLLVAIKNQTTKSQSDFIEFIEKQAAYLDSARPTAVNLGWGLKRMVSKAKSVTVSDSKQLYDILVEEAIQIHQQDIDCCQQIGRNGAPLIEDGMGVLTHCNAGSLAVSELGTALSPMYVAHDQGKKFKAYAGETRPLLQGARLTSWELQRGGVDVTLICDGMAAHFMSKKKIQLVIVGADRVAANGDVANKIGTLGVAILANYYNVPFYVACPFSTIDLFTPTGDEIPIEERDRHEVTHFGEKPTAPEDILVGNPAFDITPHHLVRGIITEKGIISPPYEQNLKDTFG
ncbi:MAG: S-methyl-5-thioribose-1-phosphate isomerase [Proteobacteria bacterium]|nr:S-methyl-5-thioribose-1-phosphate isomerase [Pseudomonadota bacterium]